MGLFNRRPPQKTYEQLIAAGRTPNQAAWLLSDPEPGEALVDTGLSSAADVAKLRISPEVQIRMGEITRLRVAQDRAEASRQETPSVEATADEVLLASVRELLGRAGLSTDGFGPVKPIPDIQAPQQ